jgi:hypothetical protein
VGWLELVTWPSKASAWQTTISARRESHGYGIPKYRKSKRAREEIAQLHGEFAQLERRVNSVSESIGKAITELLEVLQRKRETVVDAAERRFPFGEPFNQPLGNAPTSPVFARAGRRLDFLWGGQSVGRVNAQTFETRLGCLGAGVIDTDIAFECGVRARPPREWRAPYKGTRYFAFFAFSALIFAHRAFAFREILARTAADIVLLELVTVEPLVRPDDTAVVPLPFKAVIAP